MVHLPTARIPHGIDVCTADKIVKVPSMAESISEGTLKQWSKGSRCWYSPSQWSLIVVAEVGAYVEQDEEIATIETDKVRTLTPPAVFYIRLTLADRCRCECSRGRHHQRVLGE